jgi:hypothetical protein
MVGQRAPTLALFEEAVDHHVATKDGDHNHAVQRDDGIPQPVAGGAAAQVRRQPHPPILEQQVVRLGAQELDHPRRPSPPPLGDLGLEPVARNVSTVARAVAIPVLGGKHGGEGGPDADVHKTKHTKTLNK